eukprot:scaffold193365_cov23-Tisochrysis_lutea.AAC.1
MLHALLSAHVSTTKVNLLTPHLLALAAGCKNKISNAKKQVFQNGAARIQSGSTGGRLWVRVSRGCVRLCGVGRCGEVCVSRVPCMPVGACTARVAGVAGGAGVAGT